MRVAECHFWGDVAEDCHECIEAHAAVHECCRVGVAELVRVHVFHAGVSCGGVEAVADSSASHSSTVDDPQEFCWSLGSRIDQRPTFPSVPGPFVERCTGLFVERDCAFGAEFADWDFEPGAVTGVVEHAVKFKVEKFAEADSGPAENFDCEACGGVGKAVDCCHEFTIVVWW